MVADVLLSRAMDIKWAGSLGRTPFYTQSKISRTRLGLLMAGLFRAGLLIGALLGLLMGGLLMGALLIGALLIGALLMGGAFLPLLGPPRVGGLCLGPPRANRG